MLLELSIIYALRGHVKEGLTKLMSYSFEKMVSGESQGFCSYNVEYKIQGFIFPEILFE